MNLQKLGYVKAATLYIAREPQDDDECFWNGCAAPPLVGLTFLADSPDESGEAFVLMCRTHMHGFLGSLIDKGEAVKVDDE